ncbi:hypothetical protein [Prochlorococcus sp. MIT 1223]|uniref:hypothetical protein n=1 Tax=Prochlorococcus sp. MIT 1223 TaxID=3096217 RepID=UPI002A75F69B|nr:hypothetical protein [Prochlorococcus sp. MIT 1223]
MPRKHIHWVNTPVLMEAILRYEQKRLPKPMRLWIESLLDMNSSDNKELVSKPNHI